MTDTKSKFKKLNNGHIFQKDYFVVSIFSQFAVPKFNENLRTQSNKREEYQRIRTVKTFEFGNTSHVKKMLRTLRKV